MKAHLFAASVAALVCLGGGVQAAEFHKDGMTAKEVQAWLSESGYRAELAKDDEGDTDRADIWAVVRAAALLGLGLVLLGSLIA